MKPQTRQALTAALFEAFFVVLGVILALAANEWRQNLAEQRQGRDALSSIVEEIKSNQTLVQESLDYHQGLLGTIESAQRESSPPGLREFPRGFISPARVLHTAWQTASDTGALQHIPYSTVLKLSGVYAAQDRYEVQARAIGEIIYGEIFRGGAGSVLENSANLASLIGAFWYREKELAQLYSETLSSLETAR